MMSRCASLVLTILCCAFAVNAPTAFGDEARMSMRAQRFVSETCADCHTGPDGEGGFDVEALTGDISNLAERDRWVRMIDRVEAGEMPPPEDARLSRNQISNFVDQAGDSILEFEQKDRAVRGRVFARRLTNLQLERTLQDLLGIDIPLATLLPDEQRTGGYATVAAGQSMSHFDLANHLMVVDTALEEAFRRATTSPDEWKREMSAQDLVRRRKGSRNREPEMHEGKATVWSHGLVFYGKISPTAAKEDGWYRLTFDVSTFKQPDYGVWTTVRSGECNSSAPSMTEWDIFQATDKKQTVSVEAWLPAKHMFEVKPHDSRLKKARTQGGQVGAGECQPQNVPGIGIHKATLERIHKGPDDDGVRKLLFDDLKVELATKRSAAKLVSNSPERDLERLMLRFAQNAYRRPIKPEEIAGYVDLAKLALVDGDPLLTVLRDGYRALLCSARFNYLYEEPGKLDDHALAARLSYFLWNTMPDAELRELADARRLANSRTLEEQVDRMLADEKGKRFVIDFADQWLDLCDINFTEPDRRLYGSFDLIVQESMLDETRLFLQAMLDDNMSVTNLVDSRFTYLNERLGSYYGATGVKGEEMRRIPIPADHPRGGLLTQGAILKVTANGTNTSPIIRGVWVSERLLGVHIPPPPENVPAVEPDIRGAQTIREQLAKHQSDAACSVCHKNIDPPGFALENFDPAGRWRTNYLKSNRKKGPTINASFTMPDGKSFNDIVQFQEIIGRQRAQLARNVAAQLITYGTGAPIGYSDREAVDKIMVNSRRGGFGFRTILHQFVQSPMFTEK